MCRLKRFLVAGLGMVRWCALARRRKAMRRFLHTEKHWRSRLYYLPASGNQSPGWAVITKGHSHRLLLRANDPISGQRIPITTRLALEKTPPMGLTVTPMDIGAQAVMSQDPTTGIWYMIGATEHIMPWVPTT